MNPFRVPEVQGPISASSLLARSPLTTVAPSTLQSQVDGCMGGFVTEATRVQTMAALFGAGMAYRLTRVGVMGSGLFGNPLLTRAASLGLGLAGESAVFTGINRSFNHFNPTPSRQSFGQEWIHSAVTLGALKGFGVLGSGQNFLVRHVLSDVGMVSGHHLAYGLGLQVRPEGTLAEQFFQAEALNWQMAAGLSLTHRLAPGLAAAERGLDLPLHATATPPSRGTPLDFETLSPALAGSSRSGGRGPSSLEDSGHWMRKPSIMAMAGEGNGAGNGVGLGAGSAEVPPEILYETPPLSRSEGSGSSPLASEGPTPLETRPPPEQDLSGARYHLPKTPFFNETGPSLSFSKLLNYARSVSRARLVGSNTQIVLPTPLKNAEEYSPGGAAIVEHLREDPNLVHTLTGKWEWVQVASPTTAILGLGSATVDANGTIQAEMGDSIMRGKGKNLAWAIGANTVPLCYSIRLTRDQRRALEQISDPRRREEQAGIWRAERFAESVLEVASNFGAINIEDARGGFELFRILEILKELRGTTSVWDDDMKGTGVVTAGGMLAWAFKTGRLTSDLKLSNIRGIIYGAGAGATGVYEELLNHGVLPENILVVDSRGPLHEGRRDIEKDPYKVRMRSGIPENTTVEGFARGSNFLINLGSPEVFTRNPASGEALIRSLAKDPLIALMTNPEPGFSPEEIRLVRLDAHYASGNQTYENTFNNFAAFPFVLGGALMAKAGDITPAMTVAAAQGIFETAKLGPPEEIRDRMPAEQREFGSRWLVPLPDDMRLVTAQAGAVAKAAARDGVAILLGANPSTEALARFDREIDDQVRFRLWLTQSIRSFSEQNGPTYLAVRHARRYAPFRISENEEPIYEVAPEIRREHFEILARQMGLKEERWQDLLTPEGELKPTALTEVLNHLLPATQDTPPPSRLGARAPEPTVEELALAARTRDLARREIKLITDLAVISPSLGLALALRRTRVRPENLNERPTVFHRPAVLRTVLNLIPEAQREIETSFEGITPIH